MKPTDAQVEAAVKAVTKCLQLRLRGPNGEHGIFDHEAPELARAALEAAYSIKPCQENVEAMIRRCLSPFRPALTDEQYRQAVADFASALQDAWEDGWMASGGMILDDTTRRKP